MRCWVAVRVESDRNRFHREVFLQVVEVEARLEDPLHATEQAGKLPGDHSNGDYGSAGGGDVEVAMRHQPDQEDQTLRAITTRRQDAW